MDEIEWWELDSLEELAEQAAGDVGFVVASAIEAHGSARLALSPELPDAFVGALANSRETDWARVTLLPTDDRLVASDHPLSGLRRLEARFGALGATLVPLADQAELDDYRQAGRLADARLATLDWPLDLVCLTIGEDGHVAGMLPGPDLDGALSGPRERRVIGLRPDPLPPEAPYPRVTLTGAALSSARAVMIVASGAAQRSLLERAIAEGPLSSVPVGRVIAGVEAPIDIFWSA